VLFHKSARSASTRDPRGMSAIRCRGGHGNTVRIGLEQLKFPDKSNSGRGERTSFTARRRRHGPRWVGVIRWGVDHGRLNPALTGVLFRRKCFACPCRGNLPGRAFAKPEKLFQVMLPVHYMKLSPLRRTQRAQNRDGRARGSCLPSALRTA